MRGLGATNNALTYTTGTTLYGNPVGGTLRGGGGDFIEGSGGRKMSLEIIHRLSKLRLVSYRRVGQSKLCRMQILSMVWILKMK